MKQKIDTIIFDLGGVLVDWDPKNVYLKVFNGNVEKTNWFIETVCTHEWNMAQDGGRTIEEAVTVKIAEFPQYEELIRIYYNEWHHMFSGIIEENVALFKKMKDSGKYKIYALTNWSDEKWDLALELFPFFNSFDGVVVSGKEKTHKPLPEIYHLILNRFQINPESTIFIDDNPSNIEAANKFNLHTIHFKSNSNLALDLNKFGIIF
ncbi:HAD family phosphatase [Lutibacter sp.]|uniref:HAD family hydrolase n=1 Tax=Lutibacter sp. TaxID=1925666 RepID=UPI00273610C2|nr:HAD family phosphatase [Lutibacter sp.]MDP3312350.1 HAD family phosphatase [Lutibacter sp.]